MTHHIVYLGIVSEQVEGIELVERDGCGVEGSDQEKNRCHQAAYTTTTATVHNEKN